MSIRFSASICRCRCFRRPDPMYTFRGPAEAAGAPRIELERYDYFVECYLPPSQAAEVERIPRAKGILKTSNVSKEGRADGLRDHFVRR